MNLTCMTQRNCRSLTPQQNSDKTIAVSYSGGKDSLATLYLALEAGLKPPIIFIDTGLEFPETVENVRMTAEKYGLPLVPSRIPGDNIVV